MDYAKVLSIMERVGRKLGAPVYSIGALVQPKPFRSVVFIMLSARSTDVRTYKVCEALFAKADSPEELLKLEKKELIEIIRPIGFYNTKSKNLLGISKMLLEDFGGDVPSTREELMRLPGVGRKTANLVLNSAFGANEIGVDVHVHKIANRLGWVKTKTPEQTELALRELLPKRLWRKCNLAMVGYGQTVCSTRNPKCKTCKIRGCCKRVGLPKLS